jgi:hypothetical protein
MTPYLEACFGGGGRIGFFVTGTPRESDWEYEHESESMGFGTFLSYPADSALADL